MKPKTPSPAVLKSCTAAAHAAEAHAQESANAAASAINAAEAANESAGLCRRLTANLVAVVDHATVVAYIALVAAVVAVFLTLFA